MTTPQNLGATFSGLIDLAAERIGGTTLLASDEFFAEKENLLKPGRGLFIPDKYTDRGKWMDGWETRRKRTPGHDWCIIKLGLAGQIRGFDIDTNHFLGNYPAAASVDGCEQAGDVPLNVLSKSSGMWKEILPKTPLQPGSQNLFAVENPTRWTHARLNIYPDGGVARFRVYGTVMPDWTVRKKGEILDFAAVENGGLAVAASDMFFSPMNNLIMPERAATMGDGWETKRRRGPGNDWVIIKLGTTGVIQKVEVDTNHFKGNYPDRCSIDVCSAPDKFIDTQTWKDIQWKELLPETRLEADRRHFFEHELRQPGPVTHLRLNIFPDGGVSRLRVWGTVAGT